MKNNFLEIALNFYKGNKKMLTKILAVAAGSGIGFLVYKFIGCRTGTCPITSNPWTSVIWGGLIGFLLAS